MVTRRMASAVLLLSTASAPVAAFHLEESLRGSTAGNLVGGQIEAGGWRVTSRTDRLWYALPTLVSGSVQFTLADVTQAALGNVDNEIFALYEAGYGMSEPIPYSPDFRNNHYKVMLRVYGNLETGREGAQKLMWGMCPSGTPGYDACGCNAFFEEPWGGVGGWDGSPQVRLRPRIRTFGVAPVPGDGAPVRHGRADAGGRAAE